MRLLKTHSHTSERPGYEARKARRKAIEENAVTIIRQTTRQNLPRTASVAGGLDRTSQHTSTTNLSAPVNTDLHHERGIDYLLEVRNRPVRLLAE